MSTTAPDEVTLRDGAVAEIRPAGAADAEAVERLYAGLSLDSRAKRFMTGGVDVHRVAALETRPADPRHLALVATMGENVVAIGSLEITGPAVAEVAFAVADEEHGHGLGTLLLERLAAAAVARGIERLEGLVLPYNRAMIEVFRDSGLPLSVTSEDGLLRVEMPAAPTPEARQRFADRERLAAVAGVAHVLGPRSVAVIGASPRRGTVAGEVTHNVIASGFAGPLHLVNLRHAEIAGRPVVRSVADVDGDVELAVVVVAGAHVLGVARECAAKRVRALLVISAGFAEDGAAGRARQAELLGICRASGMRLVGPNCMGVATPSLAATFAPELPPPGAVAIASQSGGLGLAAMHHARELGIGLSAFVSFGNRADVSSNDLLQFWEQDEATRAIALYLESFGHPRKFSRIARRVTRTKPVIAVKAGRTPAGARAAGSHTGALVAASDITVDALFRQAGVLRVDTADELVEVAALLAALPAPRGPRVAIVSNAGGLGILAADACDAERLEVPVLSAALRERIAGARPEASTANPVDLLPDPSPAAYRAVVEALAASGEVDAVVAIYAHPFPGADAGVPAAVADLAEERPSGLPVVPVLVGGPRSGATAVPVSGSPERAVHALAHARAHAERAQAPEGTVPRLGGLDGEEGAAIVADALARGGGWLDPRAVERLLRCYGIPLVRSRVVPSATAAAEAARELGGAVVLKVVSPDVVHKSEAGAIRLGLIGPTAVRQAASEMRRAVEAAGHEVEGFVVQEHAAAGVELLVGVVHDEVFGPVVACGAGGTTAEILRDVAVRLAPLTLEDAAELPRELRSFPLLEGFRGAPRADVAAVEDVLVRVGLLADAHPEIAELDLNPLIAGPDGAVVVDARVRVAARA